MDRPILLACAGDVASELVDRGGLPKTLLADIPEDQYMIDGSLPPIRRIDPDRLLPPDQDDDAGGTPRDERDKASEWETTRRQWETLCAAFHGHLVCHLFVADSRLDASKVGMVSDLTRHAGWHRRFRSGLREFDSRQGQVDVRSVGIAVCTHDLERTQQSCLHELVDNGCGGERPVYLMMRLLDLGEGQVLHAESVWPLYVAALLRKFLAQSVDDSRDGGLYAWRVIPVVPELAGMDPDARNERMARILDGLSSRDRPEEVMRPEALPSGGAPSPRTLDLPSGPNIKCDWPRPFGERLSEVVEAGLDPAGWIGWRDAVRGWCAQARDLASRCVAIDLREPLAPARGIWRPVHEGFAHLWRRTEQPMVDASDSDLALNWQNFVTAEHGWLEQASKVRGAAAECERAAGGQVDLPGFIVCALVSSLAAAYAGIFLAWGLLDALGPSSPDAVEELMQKIWVLALVGLSGVAGALVVAFGLSWWQNRCGLLAMRALGGMIGVPSADGVRSPNSLVALAGQREGAAGSLKNSSLATWRSRRTQVVWRRGIRLLERLRVAANRELTTGQQVARKAVVGPGARHPGTTAGRRVGRDPLLEQQERLAWRKLWITVRVTEEQAGEHASPEVVQEAAANELDGLWRDLVSDTDKQMCGNIPARRVANILRTLVQRVETIFAETFLSAGMTGADPVMPEALREEIRARTEDERFTGFVSCRLEGGAPEFDRHVLFRGELDWVKRAVGGLRRAEIELPATHLPGLIALLVDRVRVSFEDDGAEMLAAKPVTSSVIGRREGTT